MDKHLRNKDNFTLYGRRKKLHWQEKRYDSLWTLQWFFFLAAVQHCNLFTVDTKPMLAVAEQIYKIGVNINQIAKAVNISGNLYKSEVKELQEKIEEMSNFVHNITEISVKARNGDFNNGIFENTLPKKRGTSGRGDIDNAVKQSNCYEDFLKIMQSYNYEVKIGKYLYFKKQGNKNFINIQTLGTAYSEKNIKSKIYGTNDIQNHNIAPHLNHFIKHSYRKLLKNSIDYMLKESSDFED